MDYESKEGESLKGFLARAAEYVFCPDSHKELEVKSLAWGWNNTHATEKGIKQAQEWVDKVNSELREQYAADVRYREDVHFHYNYGKL